MKRIVLTLLAAAMLVACGKQNDTEEAIRHMVKRYPQTTMQDVYKSFYQARFGAEHMINDTASVRAYLLNELTLAAEDDTIVWPPFYEPVGANNAYVRVYLTCVVEQILTEEQLFDAFIRSATPAEQPKQSWADEWTAVEQAACKAGVPCIDEESQLLMQAAQNNRAVHHSEAYRNAYRPHYRIVRKDIFDKELNSYINKTL